MMVGAPKIDIHGVKYYPVKSVYQGYQREFVRVLEPTNPVPGKPRRLVYVLPVEAGVNNLKSTWSDGLEELRLLDVSNRFNMTLIAPSFPYEPWYGDDVTNPTHRMESFIVDDLVPFGERFAQGNIPQRYLLGFSKSGNGAFTLLLRNPRVFNGATVWDFPAQLSSFTKFPALRFNFGTEDNFRRYNIPALVLNNNEPFKRQTRLWISGDRSDFIEQMIRLNDQLTAASILHTWAQEAERLHSWNGGWLNSAVMGLDALATLAPPDGGTIPPVRTGGQPAGVLAAGTHQMTLSLMTDEGATCRYATTAGVAYGKMPGTFSNTGGTAHSTVVTGLMDGGRYSYYIRCQDDAKNTNQDDYVIAFTVIPSSGFFLSWFGHHK